MSPSRQTPEQDPVLAELAGVVRGRLTDGAGPAAHERGWTAVKGRIEAPARRPMRWTLAATAGATALAVGLWLARPRPLTFTVDGAADTLIARGVDGRFRFSDGSESRITTADGRARVVETTAQGARIALDQGSLRVRVHKRPGARWAVLAGPFTLEVTGTEFDVAWSSSDARLDVRLHSGAVVVRGASRSWPLRAGQRLEVRAGDQDARVTPSYPPALEPAVAPAAARPAPESTPPGERAAPPPPRARAEMDWSARLRDGDYVSVVSDAEARGIDRVLSRSGNGELAALADAAHLSGRTALARLAWRAQRQRFPRSEDARQAAFFLGRLADDADGEPAAALAWYARYLTEAPDGAFAAEALGRKMLAQRRLGGGDSARPVADEYLRRFPRGTYADAARRIVGRAQ